MGKVLDVLLFIITIPFKIFKYANLAFYYLIKLIVKETPEKKEEPVPIEKINESEMIGVYAAPAPKMSLAERIKEKLTK